MVGNLAMGVQSNQVMGDIKHYVLNDQETGRNSLNAILNKRAMQETDLLSLSDCDQAGQARGCNVAATTACEWRPMRARTITRWGC